MIEKIMDVLGYTGNETVVTYLVISIAGVLTICLAYRLFDFILSLISSFLGRGNDIKF